MSNRKVKDPFDGEYMGNIFGRNFTIFGIILLLLVGGTILYRHIVLDVPFGMEEVPPTPAETVQDTVKVE